jgi:hypothetical protein
LYSIWAGYFIFQPTLVVNLLWSVYHAHKSYWELILYLPNSDLELYSHSFQFCFSHCNFIIWPTLMIILLWSCTMMHKLNMMIIIFWEHDNFIIWPMLMIILFDYVMNMLNMMIIIFWEHDDLVIWPTLMMRLLWLSFSHK